MFRVLLFTVFLRNNVAPQSQCQLKLKPQVTKSQITFNCNVKLQVSPFWVKLKQKNNIKEDLRCKDTKNQTSGGVVPL